ncbi:MAG: hypothetical protein PHN84_11460 [Desulfuromonadaceae bacterium]|nr:hypothetical protein [Desulfuromonadaceae bacterium]MDD2855937.1 hypothetical protein [Desulfuromonadaceae bacterium]
MITTLTAYKEMLMSSAGQKPPTLPGTKQPETGVSAGSKELPTGTSGVSNADSVELSASHDVFTAVDNFFNMGRSGRFDAFHSLSPEDKEQFVKIVAELAKSGYMGYEELIVNKKVERHELSSQIGDNRLEKAKIYDSNREPHH